MLSQQRPTAGHSLIQIKEENMPIRCRWYPDVDEFADVLFYSRFYSSPGKVAHWRCESFASLLVWIGAILIFAMGIDQIVQLNPSDAFMASTIVKNDLCLNLTCGGHYCSFTQPIECKAAAIHLEQGETAEFCGHGEKCEWKVEVLSNSGFENRSNSVYILNNLTGEKTYFPQLESMMRKYVDVTKYVKQFQQDGEELVEWDVVPRLLSEQMSSCAADIPAAVKQGTRCGSYSIFLDSTVYETAMMQRYSLEWTKWMVWIVSTITTMVLCFYGLIYTYRYAQTFDKAVAPPHRD